MDCEKACGEGRGGGQRGGGGGCGGGGGGSRLWIFVVVGAVVEVGGVVMGGLYLNVRSLTSSLPLTHVIPAYVPTAAVLLTGLFVLLLFWKRVHILVFVTSVVSVGVGLLCGGTAVLTGTHIIQPMTYFRQCTWSRDTCHCLSPYSRQHLSLQYSEEDLTSYVYGGVSGCSQVREDLVQVLVAMAAVQAAVAMVLLAVAVLALLAYRTERRLRALRSDSYEEIFTVSNYSPNPPVPESSRPPNTATRRPAGDPGGSGSGQGSGSGVTEFIYSPSDVPLAYHEACRVRPRSHSLSLSPTRGRDESGDDNPASANTIYASSTLGRGQGRVQGRNPGQGHDFGLQGQATQGQAGQGRLKEHRRRARRAVTLANLDRDQLLLIMGLQLRYLQEGGAGGAEGRFGANTRELQRQERRASTPTPRLTANPLFHHHRHLGNDLDDDVDLRPVRLPRSHTPQPIPTSATTITNLSPQPLTFPSFSAGYHGNGSTDPSSMVDYEDVDGEAVTSSDMEEDVAASSRAVLASRHPRPLNHPTAYPPSSSTTHPRATAAAGQEDSGYVVMHGGGVVSPGRGSEAVTSAGAVTSSPGVISYENVSDLGGGEEAGVAHRDPLYENQREASRRRRQTPGVPAQVPTPAPRAPPRRAMSETPAGRPKSYINAVEGVGDGESSDDSEDHAPLRPAPRRLHQSQPVIGSSATPLLAFSPAPSSSAVRAAPDRRGHGQRVTSSSSVDIYSTPRKQRRLPARRQGDGHSSALTLTSTSSPGRDLDFDLGAKSAFHKVSSRPSPPPRPPPYLDAPCDTDLDELDSLPRSRWRRNPWRAPPYSSPPSYECLAGSRHGSQRSLLSQLSGVSGSGSSSRHAGDEDTELYRQVVKPTPQHPHPNHSHPNNPSHPHHHQPPHIPDPAALYCNGDGRKGQGHVFQGQGQGRAAWHDYQAAAGGGGMHSFPFRKHHPHPYPHPAASPAHARSYENLDEVFEAQPDLDLVSRNGRSCQGQVAPDLRNGKVSYQNILDLHSGQGEESDTEELETVI